MNSTNQQSVEWRIQILGSPENQEMKLVEYSMNSGNKGKAKNYLQEAETTLNSFDEGNPAHLGIQFYEGQIVKYRNWLE
ncbi:MAG: hypothetical protein AAF490_29975 [Chloroflexota bacterium]